MVKLKNYNVVVTYFILILTIFTVISCRESKLFVTKIEGKEIGITDKNKEVAALEAIIKPYREHIDKELGAVLATAPELIDKSGEWQTPMGNLLAAVTLQKSNSIFYARENKNISFCLLNHGGIRSIIPKGNVTARTAFEIMPFENSAVVVALKGAQILEIATYIINEKKPHPLAGMTFTIVNQTVAKDIEIQGMPLDLEKTYYVVTSDYLANGGDSMNFFKKGIQKYVLDYKLRNQLIDYFKENALIVAPKNRNIRVE